MKVINNIKLAILIPTTSFKQDNWKNINDTFLYNNTLKTFKKTFSYKYPVKFFIGIDKNDRIWDNFDNQHLIKNLFDFPIQFYYLNADKGHLTKMWNQLFFQAIQEKYNYFYQCGDDITFYTKNWDYDSILILKKNNDIGISGPKNNHPTILTQAMFSIKHYHIFNFLFNEEIINWCCDDWYNLLYQKHRFILNNHFCSNDGNIPTEPRYIINNDKNFNLKDKFSNLKKNLKIIVNKDINILNKYLLTYFN